MIPANGTHGDVQRHHTCRHCVHDHDWHNGYEGRDSCPIIMRALVAYGTEDKVDEWQESDDGIWSCTGYARCECADTVELIRKDVRFVDGKGAERV